MNHQIRTSSAQHPNFARDLVRDPFSAEEWAQLGEWQKNISSRPRALLPERFCVVCKKNVPLLRRRDSTTCSRGCAAVLRQRSARRRAGKTKSTAVAA